MRSFAGTKKVENVPPRKWQEASLARPCPSRPGWPPGANQTLCEGENRLVKLKDWKSGKSESINEMAPKASSTSVAAKQLAGSEANAETVRSSRTRLSTASLYFKRFRWRLHMCRDYAGSVPLEEHVPVLQQQNPNFLNPGKKRRKTRGRTDGSDESVRPKRWVGRGQKDLFMRFLLDFCVCLCGCDDAPSLSSLVLCVVFFPPFHSIPTSALQSSSEGSFTCFKAPTCWLWLPDFLHL